MKLSRTEISGAPAELLPTATLVLPASVDDARLRIREALKRELPSTQTFADEWLEPKASDGGVDGAALLLIRVDGSEPPLMIKPQFREPPSDLAGLIGDKDGGLIFDLLALGGNSVRTQVDIYHVGAEWLARLGRLLSWFGRLDKTCIVAAPILPGPLALGAPKKKSKMRLSCLPDYRKVCDMRHKDRATIKEITAEMKYGDSRRVYQILKTCDEVYALTEAIGVVDMK